MRMTTRTMMKNEYKDSADEDEDNKDEDKGLGRG